VPGRCMTSCVTVTPVNRGPAAGSDIGEHITLLNPGRPGMKKLLEYAEQGDTVVVWRVDRLGRSLIDVLKTVNLLRERGIHVRSISDGIDPATSTGRLMLNMLAPLRSMNVS